jgi:chemotaxis response regulator CheB
LLQPHLPGRLVHAHNKRPSTISDPVNYSPSRCESLFATMAQVCGSHAVSVVLSGLIRDGACVTAAVKECGGLSHEKTSSEYFEKPSAAI